MSHTPENDLSRNSLNNVIYDDDDDDDLVKFVRMRRRIDRENEPWKEVLERYSLYPFPSL